ncbi:hypothetical protein JS533_011015 [Bifidobacterium amazonense]|uniref:Uncharacterized protein n=1 Tax=Bifidobacterium amazonense TaxID=2809027 RepID=A0ABS9VXH6_9BIFI|nr:hypothetical protein [Bifidobacterium amazonense]MCH9276797.1 hypothetical protein [Bifidobacterium amazonense]
MKQRKRPVTERVAHSLVRREGTLPAKGAHWYLQWRALENNDRVVMAAVVSATIGMLTAVVKFAIGVWAMSLLFIATGVYYAILCAARSAVIRTHVRTRVITDANERRERELRVYRRTGMFLFVVGLAYAMSCVAMLSVGRQPRTNMIVAITVATITSVKIGGAIRGMVVAHRTKDPIDSSVKYLSFADALFSLVTTQNVLLLAEHSPNATVSSALFGIALGVVVMALGIWMTVRRPRFA